MDSVKLPEKVSRLIRARENLSPPKNTNVLGKINFFTIPQQMRLEPSSFAC